ncbi:hypothetical protein BDK88_3622 [Natrinema hispanicum]|uniref:Uncharacterized protein n=2 Tax=Natrinema hispanicum TaxID=392421 RepID=A0A482Y4U7_9EURY|nr:hypothetical protein BDK88_3622 [Natrinema hispanicum]
MLLKGIGGAMATQLLGSSAVAAEVPDGPYKFNVSKLPASVGYVEDPKGRQKEAWDAAQDIHKLEQSASDALKKYSTEDIAAVMGKASAARSDLRSFSRLVEVLHERNLAGIIDESLLNSIGRRADIVVRYAPLIGSVNNVLKKAEAFATAISGPAEIVEGLSKEQRTKYVDFVLSLACLCLETGLMWVGAPFKLAWKGTQKIFFARSGTLFRLGRYGGDRFVAFFMSELHWEIREALFDDVITTEKAKWVTNKVNDFKEEPQFTELREDAESLVKDRSNFDISDYEGYDFAKEQAGEAADAGSDVLGEVVELAPKGFGDNGSSKESLVLKSTMDWKEDAEQEDDGLFSGF